MLDNLTHDDNEAAQTKRCILATMTAERFLSVLFWPVPSGERLNWAIPGLCQQKRVHVP